MAADRLVTGARIMQLRTVIKLVILSGFVGLLMVIFGISPTGFWEGVARFFRWLWELLTSLLDWGLIYIVTGAAIVVPIYLLRRLLRARKRPGKSSEE
jgi:hypothetical protein